MIPHPLLIIGGLALLSGVLLVCGRKPEPREPTEAEVRAWIAETHGHGVIDVEEVL